jgi:hypothetical protein
MKILTEELSTITNGEAIRGVTQHGMFKSRHESYAVILEEFEEAEHEIEIVKDALNCYWSCVKQDVNESGELMAIAEKAISAAAELIQVSAMARKTIASFERGVSE